MSKRPFRIALATVLGSLLVVGIVVAMLISKACAYPTTRHDGSGKIVAVEIKSGLTFPAIARELADKGVIDHPTWFKLYGMWRGVTSGAKPGHYQLRDDMTPEEVLDTILAGVKEVTTDVAIPEGLNMLEVFALIEKSGVAKASELEKLGRDPAFLSSHGLSGESVEGYLFPSKYNFRVPEKPQAVLERLIDTYRKNWKEVAAEHKDKLAKLEAKTKWSDRDVLTLASIVQKEAGVKEDDRRIAQVFVNRITDPDFKPKLLQTDPTIRYGCEVPLVKSAACQAWDRKALLALQMNDSDNPYNTYRHEGLPPGPISNPGRDAMEAAADPDGSDYFYFVVIAKGSAKSAFARTKAEHDANVRRYRNSGQ
jgi:UPF0755 protein